jgi:tripartite-type tricarboxylate transporter receptor subunit TctC
MMHSKSKTRRAFAVLALSTLCLAGRVSAQGSEDPAAYPSRPITIVVGFTPAGATDLIARMVATKLSAALGKPVIVDNKPGAGSNIATEYVVRAKPDGYTLLVETIANATNMSVYKNLKYDSARDLSPIIQFMSSPSVLVSAPSLPVKDLKSLIALAKSQPGKLSYASSGVGGSPHLAGEMLKLRAGIDMLHVPYKGATPALTDVMSGNVSVGFMTSLGALQHMQSGQLRPLAVAYGSRLPELPNVPTMAEAGLPNFEVNSWNGLAAPAGTPQPIIDKLNREVNKILAMPDVRKQLQELGAQAVGGSPKKFADYVDAETKKWREVVQTAGISLD